MLLITTGKAVIPITGKLHVQKTTILLQDGKKVALSPMEENSAMSVKQSKHRLNTQIG